MHPEGTKIVRQGLKNVFLPQRALVGVAVLLEQRADALVLLLHGLRSGDALGAAQQDGLSAPVLPARCRHRGHQAAALQRRDEELAAGLGHDEVEGKSADVASVDEPGEPGQVHRGVDDG